MLGRSYGWSCCLVNWECIHARSANTKTLLGTEQQKNLKRSEKKTDLKQK